MTVIKPERLPPKDCPETTRSETGASLLFSSGPGFIGRHIQIVESSLSYDIYKTHLLHAGIPNLKGVCMRIFYTMAIPFGPFYLFFAIGNSVAL